MNAFSAESESRRMKRFFKFLGFKVDNTYDFIVNTITKSKISKFLFLNPVASEILSYLPLLIYG